MALLSYRIASLAKRLYQESLELAKQIRHSVRISLVLLKQPLGGGRCDGWLFCDIILPAIQMKKR
jgi:hypothetical protein